MKNNKPNIAVLIGDPSGIGPELISKLLTKDETNQANILVIGEKNILEDANKLKKYPIDAVTVSSSYYYKNFSPSDFKKEYNL